MWVALAQLVPRVRSHAWLRSDKLTRLKQWIYIYGKFVVHYMCSCSKKSFQVFISYAGELILNAGTLCVLLHGCGCLVLLCDTAKNVKNVINRFYRS